MPELVTHVDMLALRSDILAMEQRLHTRLEIQTLPLTLRFGVMLAVWVVVSAIILKRI